MRCLAPPDKRPHLQTRERESEKIKLCVQKQKKSMMECAENINIVKYRMEKTIMVEKLSSLLMAYDFIRESYHISRRLDLINSQEYTQTTTKNLCFLRLLRPPPPLLMRIIIMITK